MVKFMLLTVVLYYNFIASAYDHVRPVYFHDSPTAMNFNDAIRYCQERNMRLASFETEAKYKLLQKWITGKILDDVYYYVSLNRIGILSGNERTSWVWLSGERLTYVQWGWGQPTGYGNASWGNEQCCIITLERDGSVTLHDFRCHILHRVLCESDTVDNCCQLVRHPKHTVILGLA